MKKHFDGSCPSLQVYWIRGKPGSGNDREYIGYTEKLPENRKAEHVSKLVGKCATWMLPCTVYGEVVELYECGDDEELALKVELLAVLWRLKSTGNLPFKGTPRKIDGKVQEGYVGGVVRGACFLRPTLPKDEFESLKKLLDMIPFAEMGSIAEALSTRRPKAFRIYSMSE